MIYWRYCADGILIKHSHWCSWHDLQQLLHQNVSRINRFYQWQIKKDSPIVNDITRYSPILFPVSAVVFAPPPLSFILSPEHLFNDFIDVGLSVDGGNRNTTSKPQWINHQTQSIPRSSKKSWKWFAWGPELEDFGCHLTKSPETQNDPFKHALQPLKWLCLKIWCPFIIFSLKMQFWRGTSRWHSGKAVEVGNLWAQTLRFGRRQLVWWLDPGNVWEIATYVWEFTLCTNSPELPSNVLPQNKQCQAGVS